VLFYRFHGGNNTVKYQKELLIMPKKTKRKVTAVAAPAPAAEVMEVGTMQAPAAATASRSFNRRAATTQVEFNPDYTYVIKDLKRIGTLAGIFFAILIALSFILPQLMR
jgi:hypothetical protein